VGPNASIFDEPEVEQSPPPVQSEGPPAGNHNQELMAMIQKFGEQLGRIDDNVLGHRTNVLWIFLNDFGEREQERDEFHRSVYNQ
jgi:hypothetical protein